MGGGGEKGGRRRSFHETSQITIWVDLTPDVRPRWRVESLNVQNLRV